MMQSKKLLATKVLASMALLMAAPLLTSNGHFAAQAQGKSTGWVNQFEKAYKKWSATIAKQIARGDVDESDLKNAKWSLEQAIKGLTEDGYDPGPYQNRADALFASVQKGLEVAKQKKSRGSMSADVPKVRPATGVDAIALAAPTWCGDIVAKMKKTRQHLKPYLKLPQSAESISRVEIVKASYFVCRDPGFARSQRWLQAYKQEIANSTGFSATQVDALFAFVTRSYRPPRSSGQSIANMYPTPAICKSLPPMSKGLAETKVNRNLERSLLCGATADELRLKLKFSAAQYPLWIIDTEAGPTTQIAKTSLVEKIISFRVNDRFSVQQPGVLLQRYAIARTIALDKAALEREIRALSLPEYETWWARIRAYKVHQRMREAKAFSAKWLAAHPEYKTVLVDAPQVAVKENRRAMEENKKLRGLVLAVEDRVNSGKRGNLDGCAKALSPHFASWLKAKAKKSRVKDVQDLAFDDYKGATVLRGLYLCANEDSEAAGLARLLKAKYESSLAQSGPINATYRSMLEAYNALLTKAGQGGGFSASRRGASSGTTFEQFIASPIARPVAGANLFPNRDFRRQTGVVKSVKKTGGRVIISFKTVRYRVPVKKCEYTNRISNIDPGGHVHYYAKCKTTGSREVKETNAPLSIPSWAAKGISKNVSMTYMAVPNDQGSIRPGWPEHVYRSKKQKKLISLYGVKL